MTELLIDNEKSEEKVNEWITRTRDSLSGREAQPGHKWSNRRVTAILRIYTTTKKSYTRENGTAAWRRNSASSNWET